ncbi:MAG: ChbG/HpnK family deacetylase [Acidimicrobiales bacterium]
MSGLVERLGFEPNERLLIVSCDDLGFSYSANVAVYEALRDGIATSASLMVPAPWARGAAAAYRGEDVGVHLTLNAEHELYRWGPITQSPSLFDGEGGFPRTIEDVWEHADLDEVRREWRAQIERAILWGFDITHFDAHLGGVELRPEFFDCYLDLAAEFQMPVRQPNEEDERRIGFPCRDLAKERGVLSPDHVISIATLFEAVLEGRSLIDALPAGVTEVRVVPSRDSPELRASAIDWEMRVRDCELVSSPGPLAESLRRDGVRTIGFRGLRQLMRRPDRSQAARANRH